MAQLYFYYSAMNAGKSTALLQSSYNYQERGMRTLVFTAEIDNRFGVGTVSSRIGLSSQAQLYNSGTSLLSIIAAEHQDTPIHCILLDECQFLTKEQVQELCQVVDELHLPVLCYGLRTDFLGELFPGSKYLLAWADKLVELKPFVIAVVKQTWFFAWMSRGERYTMVNRSLLVAMKAMFLSAAAIIKKQLKPPAVRSIPNH